MESNIKPFLTISLVLHACFFLYSQLSTTKRTIYVTFPITLQSPAPAAGQQTGQPVAAPVKQKAPDKKLVVPVKQEKVKQPEKTVKDFVAANKIITKPAKKQLFSDKLQKMLEDQQDQPAETKPGSQAQPGSINTTGGLSVDGVRFPYTYYLVQIRNRINDNWNCTRDTGATRAVVYFKITRTGKIEGLKIKESSGDKIFDQLSMRAVELASPFPPLPSEFREQYLGIYFEFLYHE
jgi:TonB family protein